MLYQTLKSTRLNISFKIQHFDLKYGNYNWRNSLNINISLSSTTSQYDSQLASSLTYEWHLYIFHLDIRSFSDYVHGILMWKLFRFVCVCVKKSPYTFLKHWGLVFSLLWEKSVCCCSHMNLKSISYFYFDNFLSSFFPLESSPFFSLDVRSRGPLAGLSDLTGPMGSIGRTVGEAGLPGAGAGTVLSTGT